MRIEIDKYIIVSDPQCMWIEEKYTGKNGKESTARDVKELLADFADCEKELRKIAEGVE